MRGHERRIEKDGQLIEMVVLAFRDYAERATFWKNVP